MTERSHIIRPPAPPYRFWMSPELAPIQAKRDAGEPLAQDEWLYYRRERGKRDLFFFAKWCFAFNEPPCPLEPTPHAALAYAWQRPSGRDKENGRIYRDTRLAMLARTNLKTTLCTQAHAAFCIVNNPEMRGLIFTHGYAFALKIFSVIKARFEGRGPAGQLFCALYPEIIPAKSEREKWTENMITVKREGSYTDATLEATGMGATITGGHFTHQWIDDPQGKQESKEQIEKIIATYDNLTPMLLPKGQRRIVGTHWGFYDLYFYIKKNHPHVSVCEREYMEDGQLVYPHTDVEEAHDLKRRNPFLFSCWYLNRPSDTDSKGFQRAWFKYFRRKGDDLYELKDGEPVKKLAIAGCNCFIIVDPTTGRTENSGAAPTMATSTRDYVGVIVVFVGPDNSWYVERAIRARWSVDELMAQLFTLVDYYKPVFVGLEQVAAQFLYTHILLTEFKRRNTFFNVVPWKSGGKNKINDRIASLQPRYHNGMIYHREADTAVITEGIVALEDELLAWPVAEYDDLSDALSAAGPLVYAPGKQRARDLTEITERTEYARNVSKLDRGSRRVAALAMREKRQRHDEFYAAG